MLFHEGLAHARSGPRVQEVEQGDNGEVVAKPFEQPLVFALLVFVDGGLKDPGHTAGCWCV